MNLLFVLRYRLAGGQGWRQCLATGCLVLQPDLFDEDIGEVVQEGKRLITRRNQALQRRLRARQADKLNRLAAPHRRAQCLCASIHAGRPRRWAAPARTMG